MERRKIPPFRPMPLRRRTALPPERRFARFYGRYRPMTGGIKGFSFRVRVGRKLQHDTKTLNKLVRWTCRRMKDKEYRQMPYYGSVERKGQFYDSFAELFLSPWFKIRRLLEYDVNVHTK